MLRIVRDFHSFKGSDWNVQELKILQKAVSEVGLAANHKISIDAFVNGLIDEIEVISLDQYRSMLCLPQNGNGQAIPSAFVFDKIAVPSYTALYRILEDYGGASATIEVLSDQLKISPKEALKQVLVKFVNREGIDTNIAIPVRDLAVELLTCMGLTIALYQLRAPNTDSQSELKKTVDPSSRLHDDQSKDKGHKNRKKEIDKEIILFLHQMLG